MSFLYCILLTMQLILLILKLISFKKTYYVPNTCTHCITNHLSLFLYFFYLFIYCFLDYKVYILFCQLMISDGCQILQELFCQLMISDGCQILQELFCQLIISDGCQILQELFCQLMISDGCQILYEECDSFTIVYYTPKVLSKLLIHSTCMYYSSNKAVIIFNTFVDISIKQHQKYMRGLRGHDRMIVGLTTTYAISSYNH